VNFTSFYKVALLSLLAGMLALSGCGGASNNLTLPAGNWSMTAAGGSLGTFYIGGNLGQSGTSLAGSMYFVGSSCFSPSQTVTFTGTVKGNNVTLTSDSVGGEVVSITASGTSGSALTGTYSITGGTTCNADSGTLTANPVPSITGTWGGPVLSTGGVSQGGPNAALAIAFTQAATASSDGTFALTGSGTFTNSTCSNTATVASAFIAGPYLVVSGDTDDGGSYSYQQVLLNNSASPTSMTGTYQVSGGNCDGDFDAPTFTKQ
jgi:hypothetical protein